MDSAVSISFYSLVRTKQYLFTYSPLTFSCRSSNFYHWYISHFLCEGQSHSAPGASLSGQCLIPCSVWPLLFFLRPLLPSACVLPLFLPFCHNRGARISGGPKYIPVQKGYRRIFNETDGKKPGSTPTATWRGFFSRICAWRVHSVFFPSVRSMWKM